MMYAVLSQHYNFGETCNKKVTCGVFCAMIMITHVTTTLMQASINKFTAMTSEEKAQRLGLVMPSSLQGRKLKWEGANDRGLQPKWDGADDRGLQPKERALAGTASVPDWRTGRLVVYNGIFLAHACFHI